MPTIINSGQVCKNARANAMRFLSDISSQHRNHEDGLLEKPSSARLAKSIVR